MPELLPSHLRESIDPKKSVSIIGTTESYSANCMSCSRPQPHDTLPTQCSVPDCSTKWENLVVQGNTLDDSEILGHFDPDRLVSMNVFARDAIVFDRKKIRDDATQKLPTNTTITTVETTGPYL